MLSMSRSGASLAVGFTVGIATCIFAVAARLRFSADTDVWAKALLIYPCAVAVAFAFLGGAIARYLLKEDMRSLHSRGVDVDAQLNEIAVDGSTSQKRLVRAFYFLQSIALLLGGYFFSAVFLAAYLILR